MSREIHYKCDICGHSSLNPTRMVRFGIEGDEQSTDLCDKCYSEMRAWLYGHKGVKDDTRKCIVLSQDAYKQDKFIIQRDVIGKEHLYMTEYGIQELMLMFCERGRGIE